MYGSVGAQEIVGEDELEALISGEEIIGADEIVGARGGAIARRKMVVNRPATRMRRFTIGIARTSVLTTATATVTVTPQETFRPERLIIPSNVAQDFGITAILVGQRSQLVSSGEIPALIFSEVSVDSYVSWDTAVVGNTIAISVVNNSAGTSVFQGAIHGTAAV